MNRQWTGVLCFLFLLVALASALFSRFSVALSLAAVPVAVGLLARQVHHMYIIAFLRQEGLAFLGLIVIPHLSNYPHCPWWEWHTSYDARVLQGTDERCVTLHLCGPAWGLMRPRITYSIFFEDEMHQPTDESNLQI
jgi:hypothetical protein